MYTPWSVIAGETPTATKWNLLGGNDADFDSRLADLEDARVTSVTSSSTPTPNSDTTDQYELTALAAGATFGAPTGTPTNGRKLLLRIKDNGSARSLAWNAIYRAIGVVLPTTTVASKTLYVACRYNSADVKWDVVGVQQEF